MIRAFIIGGRVYEMQSPSIKNIILACDILGELPQEGTKKLLKTNPGWNMGKGLFIVTGKYMNVS